MPTDEHILQQLQANDKRLTELDLSGSNVTDSDMQVLIEALRQNQTLTTLKIYGNELNKDEKNC